MCHKTKIFKCTKGLDALGNISLAKNNIRLANILQNLQKKSNKKSNRTSKYQNFVSIKIQGVGWQIP